MPYGYTGNILRVDLTTKKHWTEHLPEIFYRTYWGGRALSLHCMLKEMKAKTDPFSPDSLLIFSLSIITGTPAPAMSRYTVCAKSPLTGTQRESEAGGWWGPELKKAGFDAIIIKGSSSIPVYIYIKDGQVEIKDATHLWGKDTGDTQRIIKKELAGNRIRIAQIGLAGENLVRFANIVNELKHFNGRNGLGAVITFAMQCYKEGILTKKDTQWIELTFGNKEAMLKIIEKIARRENGLGDLLAQGSYIAAQRIGKGATEFIHHVKGQEIPMHDPRVKTGVGLSYALADYEHDHMKAAHDPFFEN